ncbi:MULTISPECIES: MerR family transcriptional regulator [Neobacillus]|uniref:MerR family transcriptional regulator n=1 Tax=Neobacillus rhizophilus TaxID=2833579 RepID=A0A942U9S9_9BACI|nr:MULTISPECIES: MerR family transcriptional regulator [Neobacillus]MBS4215252.1 MerR family transcriptional regulator [Neobacillus rhizophilus]MBU8920177.1 MerR family transcriptional regulator [Bacillus sp. FJAT-29953]
MNRKERYSINEIASMFDISSRTIRYYEEVGLLKSEERTDNNQHRYFTEKERLRLKLILRGKRQGFKLEEIKEMVDLYESNPTGQEEKRKILEYTDKKLKELDEKILELQSLKAEIIVYRKRYEET